MTTELNTGADAAPKKKKSRAKHIIDLAKASKSDLEVLGGKGARLAEMLQADFPVPPAFCITAPAFSHFIDEADLGDEIKGLEGGSVEDWGKIRAMVSGAELPKKLTTAIIDAYQKMGRPRVAVRSSAIGEDSASQSFAGQHDTVLDIAGDEALIEAVKHCWASLWSDRAKVYRAQSGDAEMPQMAVVVQTMVHPEAAGVLFTMDPVGGDEDRIILESCWGLGEGLVSGRVTTDSFVLKRDDLTYLDKQIRYKVTMSVPTGAGEVGIVKVDDDKRDVPTLTDEKVQALAKLALRVRDHYDCEQDIEWAVRGDAVYLLQARPITAVAKKSGRWTPYTVGVSDKVRDGTLWSRMDIGEIFTGILTPLGSSFARYYQYNVHEDCVRALGIREVPDIWLHMGYMQNFMYLNISLTAFTLQQSPPARDQAQFVNRFSSEEIDVSQHHNPFGQFPVGLRLGRSIAQWLRFSLAEIATNQKRARDMVASRYERFDALRKLDLPSLSKAQLNAEMNAALAYFKEGHVGYMPFYINAMGVYNILAETCGSWLGSDGVNIQNRLKADMSNLRTVEAAREVWKLAQKAKATPEVLDIIENTPLDDIPAALQADEKGARFWKYSVEPFMRNNGVRGRQEMELTHSRWVDDPAYVFQMVRKYLDENLVIDDVLESRQRDKVIDSDAVLSRLPRRRRLMLKLLMKIYSLNSRLREEVRPTMTTGCWMVRTLTYEVGRRLVEDGVLRSLDEVAYLDIHDVLAWLRDETSARQAFNRATIEERRREFQYHLRLPQPPLTLIGTYDQREAVRYTVDENAETVNGLGTSPGRITAKARVIHDLVLQADEFEPGEILVTPFTDASWTPLFAIAGGVVTDIGSMLSHSSIVAREFLIPSVVNTKTATKVIRTGDVLTIDGEAGIVQIERPEETK